MRPEINKKKLIGDVNEMNNKKLVYTAPSVKVSLIEEDILTASPEDPVGGFPDWEIDENTTGAN